MNLPLRSCMARVGWLAACLLFAGSLEALFLTQWLAYRESREGKKESYVAAVRLDPWDSAYLQLLGSYYMRAEQNASLALPYLKKAVDLNPLSARHWLDLASAYLVLGDEKSQDGALRQAIAVEPTSPEVAWEVGNYFLIRGETQTALNNLAVVERYDPDRRRAALVTSWRATQDIDLLLNYAPAAPEVQADLLAVMLQQNQSAGAAKVWGHLSSSGQALPVDSALNYISFLLNYAHRDSEQARTVWTDLVRLDTSFARYQKNPDDPNLVNNSGFEADILGAGFDWCYLQTSGVTLSQDSPSFHTGSRSMAIGFDLEKESSLGLYQYVPVQPNTDYVVRLFTRAEDVEGVAGPRVAVVDPYDFSSRFFATDDAFGSTDWKAAEGEFRTGPDTKLVAIAVVRDPKPGRVRGKYWIDDVSIVPKRKADAP